MFFNRYALPAENLSAQDVMAALNLPKVNL